MSWQSAANPGNALDSCQDCGKITICSEHMSRFRPQRQIDQNSIEHFPTDSSNGKSWAEEQNPRRTCQTNTLDRHRESGYTKDLES